MSVEVEVPEVAVGQNVILLGKDWDNFRIRGSEVTIEGHEAVWYGVAPVPYLSHPRTERRLYVFQDRNRDFSAEVVPLDEEDELENAFQMRDWDKVERITAERAAQHLRETTGPVPGEPSRITVESDIVKIENATFKDGLVVNAPEHGVEISHCSFEYGGALVSSGGTVSAADYHGMKYSKMVNWPAYVYWTDKGWPPRPDVPHVHWIGSLTNPAPPGENGDQWYEDDKGPASEERLSELQDTMKAVKPDHYQFGDVRVIDIVKYLPFPEGNVIKYVARAGRKGSKVQDLLKARRYLDIAIENAEGEL